MQQKKGYFKQLIENTLDIITVVQYDGTILYESPSIKRILGYPPGHLVNRNAFEYLHEEDFEIVQQTILKLVENPGRTRSVEFPVKRK